MILEKFLYYNKKISEKYFPEKISQKIFLRNFQ